jgi:hypothetical protein
MMTSVLATIMAFSEQPALGRSAARAFRRTPTAPGAAGYASALLRLGGVELAVDSYELLNFAAVEENPDAAGAPVDHRPTPPHGQHP